MVSYRAVGPYEHSAMAAWEKMFAWLDANGLRGEVKRGFGLAHDDPRVVAGDKCRYDACIDMPEMLPPRAWEDMMPQRLPGGAYARQRYVGPHSGISGAIKDCRDNWCATTGVVLATQRPLVEIYLDDPNFCAPEKLRTDICLPVAFAENRDVA